MIPYNIFPMFQVGPLHFNMYGVMFALGGFVALWLATREAKKAGIKKKIVEDLFFYLVIGTIIGARLFYVFFYWPEDLPFTLIGALKAWEGGLAFFGGLIGAVTAGAIYIKKHKLEFWKFANLFTLPLITAHIIGRLGDYLIGEHPGKITNLPWAIYLDGALRHPVVLYEIIGLIIIGSIIYYLKKQKKFDSFLFLVYVQLYSIQRFILDFFRIESTDPRFLGLTPSQHLVIILFVAALSLTIKKLKTRPL